MREDTSRKVVTKDEERILLFSSGEKTIAKTVLRPLMTRCQTFHKVVNFDSHRTNMYLMKYI